MRELEFIRYLSRKSKSGKPVIKGIGDDCAVLDFTKNKYMLLTTDMIAEGTHFSGRTKPFDIGWKAAACNLSDIAAMGGFPRFALVSAGIPKSKNMGFLKEIARGIESVCKKFDTLVVGGDTNASRNTAVSVTLIGEVEKKNLITRSGAKVGDLIFVTGALGEGKSKHLKFLPQVKVARILARNFSINSMIDLSDGLAMDLCRIAEASRVGACVYKSLIPLSEKSEPIDKAISTGEDFELLFTASLRESRRIIERMGKKEDLPITLIGEVTDRRSGVMLVGEDGKTATLKPEGFRHL